MTMTARICGTHFDDLAVQIKHRGLWGRVNQDAVKAADFARRYLAGKTEPEEFDPLAVASLEILSKVKQFVDPRLVDGGSGTRCPLCLLNMHTKNPIAATKAIGDVTHLMWLRVELINKGKRPI